MDVDRDYLYDAEFNYAVRVTVMRELYEQKQIRRQVIYELWKEREQDVRYDLAPMA